LLLAAFMIIWLLGDILAPVLVALVFAYLLDGIVTAMQRYHIPRPLAATIVMLVFIFFCLLLLFGVLPLLSQQVTSLIRELPNMIAKGQEQLMQLPELYPAIFTCRFTSARHHRIRAVLRRVVGDTRCVFRHSAGRADPGSAQFVAAA